ncbi:Uncharacterized protein MLTONO_0468 [Mesorhizobium loti]|nr:Uncharacterized protein MLTONO_0468 [Mesorhizobium loti]
MPVRRKKAKARPNEAEAWLMMMMSGYDFFSDLVEAGIVDDRHEVPRELAEATWHRIGHEVLDFMADFRVGFRPPERPIWAEREFGPPGKRKRRVG